VCPYLGQAHDVFHFQVVIQFGRLFFIQSAGLLPLDEIMDAQTRDLRMTLSGVVPDAMKSTISS
jgi:hypothetical protein